MRPTIFLRIACFVTLFYFLGHTSGYPWTPSETPADMAVIAAMKGQSFDFAGSIRTYWDFYLGFGLTGSLLLLAIAVLLWQIGCLAKTEPARVRPMIITLFAAFLIDTAISLNYLFIIPTATSAVIALCLGAALATARDRVT